MKKDEEYMLDKLFQEKFRDFEAEYHESEYFLFKNYRKKYLRIKYINKLLSYFKTIVPFVLAGGAFLLISKNESPEYHKNHFHEKIYNQNSYNNPGLLNNKETTYQKKFTVNANRIPSTDSNFSSFELLSNDTTLEYDDEFYLKSLAQIKYLAGKDQPENATDSIEIIIEPLPTNINSPYPDYAPVINADGSMLYFTSRRPVDQLNKKTKEGKEYIYYSKFNKSGNNWTDAMLAPEPLNQKGRFNSAIALSNDGQRMLLYRDNRNGNGDIYESILNGMVWSEPKALPEPINSKYHEPSASIAPDGRTIYFISNRPGGVGKLDIWYCVKNLDGTWSKAYNLGPSINTPDDEEGVFIHPDGKTLYFSSRGHGGFGGYDIYKTTFENGQWTKPVNLGPKINTPGDDIYLVIKANGKEGYLSSERPGSGEKDIFYVEFKSLNKQKKDENTAELTLLKGNVLSKETGLPLAAEIEISDLDKNEVITKLNTNSSTGEFMVSLPSGKNYSIHISSPGYLFYSENFNIPKNAKYKEIETSVMLEPIKVGGKVVLKNIFYDYNSAELRPESKIELSKVASLMKENPKIKIELSAHTDSRGSDAYNNRLSMERAENCMKYLIELGVDRSRIIAKGYGKQKPVITDEEINKLTTEEAKEAAHQKNRRTEFKIIEN